jgi:hypothetical protein
MKTMLCAAIATAVALVAAPGPVSAAGGDTDRYTGHFVGDPQARVKVVISDARAAFTFKNVAVGCDDGTVQYFNLEGGPTAKVRSDGRFSVKSASSLDDPHSEERSFYLIDGRVLPRGRIRGSHFFFTSSPSTPTCVTAGIPKWKAEAAR